jgi:phage I-like protein
MQTVRYYNSLPVSQPGQVPDWIELVPAGPFKGVDGRGPWIIKNSAAVIARSMADGKLPLDENHSTDLAAPEGLPSPARGWIVEMEERNGAIWGRVDWNESGKQLMIDRAYRGISPVFTRDPNTGEINQVLRASLNNTPNIAALHSLHSQQENPLDPKELRAIFGLPETADDAAVLNAAREARAAQVALPQHIAAIANAAGLTATDPTVLVTELQTARAAAGNTGELAGKVVRLETELNTVRADRAREKAVSFVDGAITAGKPIASLRDHYITRHIADAAAVEREIGALVSINVGGMPAGHRNSDDAGGDDATEMESAIATTMGLDPKKLAAARKAREANSANKGAR